MTYFLCSKDHYVEQHRGETLKSCPAALGERTRCGASLRLAPTTYELCPRCGKGTFIDYEPGTSACSACGAEKRIPTPSDQGFSVTKSGGQHPVEGVTRRGPKSGLQRPEGGASTVSRARPLTGAERVRAYRQRRRAKTL